MRKQHLLPLSLSSMPLIIELAVVLLIPFPSCERADLNLSYRLAERNSRLIDDSFLTS